MSDIRNYIKEAENLEYLASTLEYDHQKEMRHALLRKSRYS
jgi:hypothetical protein